MYSLSCAVCLFNGVFASKFSTYLQVIIICCTSYYTFCIFLQLIWTKHTNKFSFFINHNRRKVNGYSFIFVAIRTCKHCGDTIANIVPTSIFKILSVNLWSYKKVYIAALSIIYKLSFYRGSVEIYSNIDTQLVIVYYSVFAVKNRGGINKVRHRATHSTRSKSSTICICTATSLTIGNLALLKQLPSLTSVKNDIALLIINKLSAIISDGIILPISYKEFLTKLTN